MLAVCSTTTKQSPGLLAPEPSPPVEAPDELGQAEQHMLSFQDAMLFREFRQEVDTHLNRILSELSSLRSDGKKDAEEIRNMVKKGQETNHGDDKQLDGRLDTLVETTDATFKLLNELRGGPPGSPSPPMSPASSVCSPDGQTSPGGPVSPRAGRSRSDAGDGAKGRRSPRSQSRRQRAAERDGEGEFCASMSEASGESGVEPRSSWGKKSRNMEPDASSPISERRSKSKKKKAKRPSNDESDDDSPKKGRSPKSPDGSRSPRRAKKRSKDKEPPVPTLPISPAARDLVWERITQRVHSTPFPDGVKEWLLEREPMFNEMIHTSSFFVAVNMLIVSNALFIGLLAEHRVARAAQFLQENAAYSTCDLVFSVLFAIEVTLHVLGDRALFFLGPDWPWNVADLVFVALDLLNVIVGLALQDVNVGYIDGIRGGARALRLARASRIFRLVHSLKCFKKMRLLMDIIQASFGFCLCVICLMSAMFVFFSVVFMQAASDALLSEDTDRSLQDAFGSMLDSMLTLFWCMSGENTTSLYSSLVEASFLYGFALILFLFFMTFAFANSVTASMVEYASAANRQYCLERHTWQYYEIERVLKEAGTGNDTVGILEMANHLARPDVRENLNKVGLTGSEAQGLLEIIRPEQSDQVSILELTSVCSRFTQQVRSADFVQMLVMAKRMQDEVVEMKQMLAVSLSCEREDGTQSRAPMLPVVSMNNGASGGPLLWR